MRRQISVGCYVWAGKSILDSMPRSANMYRMQCSFEVSVCVYIELGSIVSHKVYQMKENVYICEVSIR